MAALALAVRLGLAAGMDRALLLGLAAPPRAVPLALAITWLGDSLTRIVATILAGVVLTIRGDRHRALALILIVTGGAMIEVAMKAIVARPRPALLPHLDHVTSTSFPSGHAANGTILYLSLALLLPVRHRATALMVAGVLVLSIGLSRIALAVHWPSDVLAGWCFGLGWILLWRRALKPPAAG